MKDILRNIVKNETDKVYSAINVELNKRIGLAKEVRKVALTKEIFNSPEQVSEETINEANASSFVKGGSAKFTQADVDSMIGDIFDDAKLSKAMIKSKAYQAGESDPKGKNPHKKDTADYHLFQLGQQIELSRS